MNASIGGVSILNIVLIFIAFYFLFLIFVVRYVLVVRQKNHIVNMIEEQEGIASDTELREFKKDEDTKICKRKGNNGVTYVVTMYIKFNMPLVNFRIPVKGQTRAIPQPVAGTTGTGGTKRDIIGFNSGFEGTC